MIKRLECSPGAQGTSCLQYKELLHTSDSSENCGCPQRCARQLAGF